MKLNDQFRKMYSIGNTNKTFETFVVNNKVSKHLEKNNAHGQNESSTNYEKLGTSSGFIHNQMVQCPKTC